MKSACDDVHAVVFGVGDVVVVGTVTHLVAARRVLVRQLRAGDAHFIEIGIGGE
jgi:hypothetical protein